MLLITDNVINILLILISVSYTHLNNIYNITHTHTHTQTHTNTHIIWVVCIYIKQSELTGSGIKSKQVRFKRLSQNVFISILTEMHCHVSTEKHKALSWSKCKKIQNGIFLQNKKYTCVRSNKKNTGTTTNLFTKRVALKASGRTNNVRTTPAINISKL